MMKIADERSEFGLALEEGLLEALAWKRGELALETVNIDPLTYKGYSARIERNHDGVLLGWIDGISDNVGFHADTVEELPAAFRAAVDEYLETCSNLGREPQKP